MTRIIQITAVTLALSGSALSGSASARVMGGHPLGSFGGMTTYSHPSFSQPTFSGPSRFSLQPIGANGRALSGRHYPLPQGLGGNSGSPSAGSPLPQGLGGNSGTPSGNSPLPQALAQSFSVSKTHHDTNMTVIRNIR